MKDAKPDRYRVDKVGAPDPTGSQYYVLDVVHDYDARVALRRLARDYRSHSRTVAADELDRLLDETAAAHQAIVEARTAHLKEQKKKRGAKNQRVF